MDCYNTHDRRRALLWGIFLIAIGGLLMMDRFGVFESEPWWRYAPLILVLFGINRIISSKKAKHLADGFWQIFLGFWLFASLVHLWGLSFHNSWPFLLIAWGVSIIVKSFAKTRFARLEANHE